MNVTHHVTVNVTRDATLNVRRESRPPILTDPIRSLPTTSSLRIFRVSRASDTPPARTVRRPVDNRRRSTRSEPTPITDALPKAVAEGGRR